MVKKGHVIPDTPISVNMWNVKDFPHAKLFFLTHFHPDHLCGLTSSWTFPIYTSPITSRLLIKKLNIKPSIIFTLEVGQTRSISIDSENEEKISVTAFDANHCFGSVMLLFQGYFGNVLYTGDFRYDPNVLDFAQLPVIDKLYLDNKYCAKECDFPAHDDILDCTSQLVLGCLRQSKCVYVGMDDLGKEDLLLKLATETRSKVFVTESKKAMLQIFGLSNIVAASKTEVKIVVVPSKQISAINVEKWGAEMPICALLPSARYCGFQFQPYNKYNNIHIQPLSSHSSFSELLAFVEKVHPRSVIPIIGKDEKGIFGIDISNRADMAVFNDLLNPTASPDWSIPVLVKNTMDIWIQNAKPSNPRKKRKISPPPRSKRKRPTKKSDNLSTSSDESIHSLGSGDEIEMSQPSYSSEYSWEIMRIPAEGPRRILRLNPD